MSDRDGGRRERDVRAFGALLPVFLGLLGAWLWWKGSPGGAAALGAAAGLAGAAFWGVRGLRQSMYDAWMWVFHPVGWLFSHLAMAVVWFGLVTPMGLLMRALGRDPMQRGFRRDAPSYWVPRPPAPAAERYFRQY